MKMWKSPEVSELAVSLTADGTHGHNYEQKQFEVPSNEPHASNPGDDRFVDKDKPDEYDPS